MSYWDFKFINCDRYKISAFCFPKMGSTTMIYTINSLNTSDWKKDMTRVSDSPTKDYRVILFVRNPYDRIFSWYKNIIYKQQLMIGRDISLVDSLASSGDTIDWYVNKTIKSIMHRMPAHTELYRFEEYDISMRKILDSIGLEDAPVAHLNPSSGLFKNLDYKIEYDEESKFLIRCKHKWDLKNLNYTFDSYGELPTMGELKNKL